MTVVNKTLSFTDSPTKSFDVISVGGGHAGCEATITAARLGLSTALSSLNLDRIAWQPFNRFCNHDSSECLQP